MLTGKFIWELPKEKQTEIMDDIFGAGTTRQLLPTEPLVTRDIGVFEWQYGRLWCKLLMCRNVHFLTILDSVANKRTYKVNFFADVLPGTSKVIYHVGLAEECGDKTAFEVAARHLEMHLNNVGKEGMKPEDVFCRISELLGFSRNIPSWMLSGVNNPDMKTINNLFTVRETSKRGEKHVIRYMNGVLTLYIGKFSDILETAIGRSERPEYAYYKHALSMYPKPHALHTYAEQYKWCVSISQAILAQESDFFDGSDDEPDFDL